MLLRFIQKLISGGPYYVRIRPQLLSIQDIQSKKSINEKPLMAISKGTPQKILAIGTNAAQQAAIQGSYTLVNCFEHPRSILADFSVAEKMLQHYFHELSGHKYLKAAPVVILHPLEKTEGGLTQIEYRALHELAIGAGAREAYVWSGEELTERNFETGQFPGDHWFPFQPEWANSRESVPKGEA